jgi:hypothetical protein
MCAIETITLGAVALIKSIEINLQVEFPSRFRKDIDKLHNDVVAFKNQIEKVAKESSDACKHTEAVVQRQLKIFQNKYHELEDKIENEREYQTLCYGKWFRCLLFPLKVRCMILSVGMALFSSSTIVLAVQVHHLEQIIQSLMR